MSNLKEVGIVTSESCDFNNGICYSDVIDVSGYKTLAISVSITTMRTSIENGTQALTLQGYNGASWVNIKQLSMNANDIRWFVGIVK